MPDPEIKQINQKKLVGMRGMLSHVAYDPVGLWREFMLRRQEIKNVLSNELYSVADYPRGYFQKFDPNKKFTKWAAVEVPDFINVPTGMKTLIIEAGLYAVFVYKGHSNDNTIFQKIFNEWLPSSAYILDERLHFEILGDKYRNNDPDSSEDIYIPIRNLT
jgi:AraC family transcriptional regulator